MAIEPLDANGKGTATTESIEAAAGAARLGPGSGIVSLTGPLGSEGKC